MTDRNPTQSPSTVRLLGVLAVPTALSLLVQASLPVAAHADPSDIRQNFLADRAALRDARQAQHLQRLQDRDAVRAIRLDARAERIERMQLHAVQALDNSVRNNNLRFDLQSGRDIVRLTQDDLGGANSAQLMLGGVTQEFRVGDKVSAAEYVAIKSGEQNGLTLDDKGRAVGGTFSLNTLDSALGNLNVAKIVIPRDITALGNFSKNDSITFDGDLINRGTVLGFSLNQSNQNGIFSADNIINRQSGTISSILPTATSQSLGDTVANFSLTLDAAHDITNSGRITSSGALTLNAGGAIINTLAAGEVGTTPTIQANQALTLNSGSGSFYNTGVLSSIQNDINFKSKLASTAINIYGVNGVFDANNGAINIRDAASINGGDVNMLGGDYQTTALNIYAGQGTAITNIGNFTGTLNTQAHEQHFAADTDNLILGNNCITGDPTYVSSGNILISGDNTFSQNVAILAAGDITMAAGARIYNPGNTVTMIAGAGTDTRGGTTNTVPNGQVAAGFETTVNLKFTPGGNIDLSNGTLTAIDTSSTTGNGGGVSLSAISTGTGGKGMVLLGTKGIDTSSSAYGSSGGNVDIFAGGDPSVPTNTITLGSVKTGGGGGAGVGGAITINTGAVKSTNRDNIVRFNSSGSATKEDLVPSGIISQNASILINGDLNTVGGSGGASGSGASAGAISVVAGLNIQAGNILAYGAGGSGGLAGSDGGDGGAGKNIVITAQNGSVTVGDVNSSGGGGGGAGGGQRSDRSGLATRARPGKGNVAGLISISAKDTVSAGAVYAVNGGDGGNPKFGRGGSGGGSYGGGGGAGASTLSGDGGGPGGSKSLQAGGGGGYFGGGASGFGADVNDPNGLPGFGGGFTGGKGPDPGPGGPVTDGTAGLGGRSENNLYAGGVIGKAGDSFSDFNRGQDAPNVGNKVNIVSGQTMTLTGSVIGQDVTLGTSSGTTGDVNIGGDVRGFSTINVSTNAGTVSSKSLNAPVVNFKSAGGSLGTSGNRILTDTAKVSISNTGIGNVYLTKNVAGDLLVSNGLAGGVFDLALLDGKITTASGQRITAQTVNLNASSIAVETQASDLNITTGGSVSVRNNGNLTLHDILTSGSVSVINVGDLTVAGIQTAQPISLEVRSKDASSSAVMHLTGAIGASVVETPSLVSLTVNGETTGPSGIVADSTSLVRASKLVLSGTSLGSFGSQGNPLITDTQSLSVNIAGSAFLQNGGSLTIESSVAGSTFTNTPRIMSVETKSGTITLGGGIKMNDLNTTIKLQSNGIVMTAGLKERLIAGTVILDGTNSSGSSAIGSLSNPILTQASKGLGASTQSDAFLNNIGNAAILTSTLSGGSTYVLVNKGDVNKAGAGGVLTAGNVIISSTGSIGAEGNPLNLDSTNLTFSAKRDVFADSAATGIVNLKSQTAGATYSNTGSSFVITAPNATQLTVIDSIIANGISLSSNSVKTDASIKGVDHIRLEATTGGITLNAPLTANLIELSAVGANQIIGQNSSGAINTKRLDITLSNGTADLQGADNSVQALTDTVSGAGKVLLRTISKLNVGTINGALQDLTLFYTAALSTTEGADFTIHSLSATPTGVSKNNSIDIRNIMTLDDISYLRASGNGNLTLSGSLVGNGNRTLEVDTGNILIDKQLSGDEILFRTHGGDIKEKTSAFIFCPIELGVEILSAGGSVSLVGNNDFRFLDSALVGGGSADYLTQGDLVILNSTGDDQKLTISAGGNIITPTEIHAKSVVLSAGGDKGIGSAIQRALINAQDVEFLASGSGASGFLTLTGTGFDNTLVGATADDTLDIRASGNIVFRRALVEADHVLIESTGGSLDSFSGSFNFKDAQFKSAGSISLGGRFEGDSVSFISSGGSIGGNLNRPKDGIDLYVNSVSATTSGGGFVSLESLSESPLTLNNSSSGQSFRVTTPGQLIVNNVETQAGVGSVNGSIELISTKGNILVNDNADIKAIGGSILISARPKTATVTIGSGATLLGSSTVADVGHVTINTGAAARNEDGPSPAGVTVDETLGGQVYFGKQGITVVAPGSILKAEGRNIDFSGDTPGSIILGGNVKITADPPAGSDAYNALVAAMATSSTQMSSASRQQLTTTATSLTTDSGFSTNSSSIIAPSLSLLQIDGSAQSLSAPQTLTGNQGFGSSSSSATILSSTVNQNDQLGLAGFVPMLTHTVDRFPATTESIGLIEAMPLMETTSSNKRFSNRSSSPFNSTISGDADEFLVGHIDKGIKTKGSENEERAVTRTSLKCGNIFCAPETSSAVIDTAFGVVTIAPNSIVLAIANDDGLAIYNLDDNHRGAVMLDHECRKFVVAPGSHLFVTHKDAEFANVNVSERILYSGIQKSKLSNGHHAFNGQFFIPSAIEAVRPLLELVTSKDSHSRAKAGRLLKTTAILLQLNGGMSSYQPHIRPRATALN